MKYETDFFLNWYKTNYGEEYKRNRQDKAFTVDDLVKAYNDGRKSCETEELQKIIKNLNEWKYYAEGWIDDKNKSIEKLREGCREWKDSYFELKKTIEEDSKPIEKIKGLLTLCSIFDVIKLLKTDFISSWNAVKGNVIDNLTIKDHLPDNLVEEIVNRYGGK